MTNAEIIALADRYLFPTYARAPLALVRGEGCRVWDADGKQLPRLLRQHRGDRPRPRASGDRARHRRAGRSDPARLQPALQRAAGAPRRAAGARARSPTASSSATAAPRPTRRRSSWRASYGHAHGDGRFEIITALGSFHGRTLATIAATGQEKVRRRLRAAAARASATSPYDDVAALERALTPRTIARHARADPGRGRHRRAEPGLPRGAARALRPARPAADLRRDPDRHGPHRHALRLRADRRRARHHDARQGPRRAACRSARCWRRERGRRRASTPGSHGSTFGGNALTCAVGARGDATLLESEGVLANCQAHGRAPARAACAASPPAHAGIRDVRGRGLLIGAELDEPGGAGRRRAAATRGLIINCTADTVLRLTPPLIVSAAEIDEALAILDRVLPHEARLPHPRRPRRRAELDEILHLSATLKRELKAGQRPPLLAGKTLAMIFEKPSLRTRVTFEVGMTQLGGYAVYLDADRHPPRRARDRSPTSRATSSAGSTDHGAHLRARHARRARRARATCR